MKRSAPARRKPLKRTSQLRTRPKRPTSDPARAAWKEPKQGFCQCGCEPPTFSLHLERHHVVELQTCKREGLPLWDLANSMLLCPTHHARHTSAFRRIPVASIPDAAIEFAVTYLGRDRAALYVARYYGPVLSEALSGRRVGGTTTDSASLNPEARA